MMMMMVMTMMIITEQLKVAAVSGYVELKYFAYQHTGLIGTDTNLSVRLRTNNGSARFHGVT